MTLHFDSLEKVKGFLCNLDRRMKALADPLFADKAPPYPELFPELRRALRDFIEVIPEGPLDEAAADFLHEKWFHKLEQAKEGVSGDGGVKTHQVTLFLTLYKSSWLNAFREQVEVTNGLPVISLEDLSIKFNGKEFDVDDPRNTRNPSASSRPIPK